MIGWMHPEWRKKEQNARKQKQKERKVASEHEENQRYHPKSGFCASWCANAWPKKTRLGTFDRCRNRCALHWTWRDRTAMLSSWVPMVRPFDFDGKTSVGFYWNVRWIMPRIIEKKKPRRRGDEIPSASCCFTWGTKWVEFAQWSFKRYRKLWAHEDTAWKWPMFHIWSDVNLMRFHPLKMAKEGLLAEAVEGWMNSWHCWVD